jgi:hypothetical protein
MVILVVACRACIDELFAKSEGHSCRRFPSRIKDGYSKPGLHSQAPLARHYQTVAWLVLLGTPHFNASAIRTCSRASRSRSGERIAFRRDLPALPTPTPVLGSEQIFQRKDD